MSPSPAAEAAIASTERVTAPGRSGRAAQLRFYWVVAACGAIIMALEILASRILAPDFGSSVYVWGSIISVFLAALSVGYWLGGRLADRSPSLAALGRLILYAAGFQAFLLVAGTALSHRLGLLTNGSPLGTLLATTLLFGPLSVLLATVSPYAVRLAARDLAHLGNTAGRLFAISTGGSLLGTLGCTFVLIPFLPLHRLLALLLLLTLLTAGVALWGAARSDRLGYGLLAVLALVAGGHFVRQPRLPSGTLFSSVTAYQTLAVEEHEGRRVLLANGMFQAAVDENGDPALPFLRHVALVAAFQPQMQRYLALGMGGGSAGSYLQRHIEGLEVDSVDIDPVIPQVAERYFGFRPGPRNRAHVADARRFLAETDEQWDVILCDTYIGLSIPFHVTTREFMVEAKRHLRPHGVFAFNLAAGLDTPFAQAIFRTLRSEMPTAHAFAVQGSSNVLVVAGPGVEEAYLPDVEARARELDRRWQFSPPLSVMLRSRIEPPAQVADAPLLLDAFAPVEHLVDVSSVRAEDRRRWQELRSGAAAEATPTLAPR